MALFWESVTRARQLSTGGAGRFAAGSARLCSSATLDAERRTPAAPTG
jgi:hypothetical protein